MTNPEGFEPPIIWMDPNVSMQGIQIGIQIGVVDFSSTSLIFFCHPNIGEQGNSHAE